MNKTYSDNKDKISLIVPCFNGEKTLKRCLDSVLAQTYPNFEVLIVDDGSTDGSAALAETYAQKDGRIRLFRKENGGVSTARNYGLDNAEGDYIEFIDCDDELLPDAFETMLTAIRVHGADVAACNFVGNPMFKSFVDDRVYDLTDERDLLEYYQQTFGSLMPWNKLFARHVVIDERFDEEEHFSEDELFNLAVMKNIRKVVTVKKPLYVYHLKTAENDGESSCMVKMANAKFWEDKTSIWYLGALLYPKRRKFLEEGMSSGKMHLSRIEDMAYTRISDYYFWEINAYAYMRATREALTTETYNVFREALFTDTMRAQERFGLEYLDFDERTLKNKVERYIDLCLDAFDYGETKANFEPVFVFYLLFSKMFFRESGKGLDDVNFFAAKLLELKNNSTQEARYVNSLRI